MKPKKLKGPGHGPRCYTGHAGLIVPAGPLDSLRSEIIVKSVRRGSRWRSRYCRIYDSYEVMASGLDISKFRDFDTGITLDKWALNLIAS